MKRYDEYNRIQHKHTGVQTSLKGESLEYIKSIDTTQFDIYVRCRSCGNVHNINVACQACDKETKAKYH